MSYEPPTEVTEEELSVRSDRVLARPDVPYAVRDELFRIDCAGLAWDVAGRVYQPGGDATLVGADGKKAGALLIHGGGGDHRGMHNLAVLLVEKFGIKVATVSYPGHFNWETENNDWPGTPRDAGDGHPRLPLYERGNPIGHDEYDLVAVADDPVVRSLRGTRYCLAAREGTQFWHRQAAWPLAYETAFTEMCAREFPETEYSVYLHGASTGGPFVHMLLQRIGNVVGLIGMETSCWGALKKPMVEPGLGGELLPFNYLTLRTWRDRARYMGVERGEWGIRHLPQLMEEVFEAWEKDKPKPGLKVEHFVQYANLDALRDAAKALADILGSDSAERQALIDRYASYTAPLSGPDVPPVPPLLYIVNENSRDHRPDNYLGVLFPLLDKLEPAPKKSLTLFYGGTHNYSKPSKALPRGVAAVGASIWHDAITKGYYTS